jgi:acyl dehydratase
MPHIDARSLSVGQVLTWERTFTEEDVRAFAALSGDRGEHHLRPDAHGRLVLHGLLTASLPTKLGGDLDFLAREMVFEFERPAYAGERLRCELAITALAAEPGKVRLEATFRCTNPAGAQVLCGRTRGVVLG